jgi:eukaryotic-like serine/threonine-protein kinase
MAHLLKAMSAIAVAAVLSTTSACSGRSGLVIEPRSLAVFQFESPSSPTPLHLAMSPDGRELVTWVPSGSRLILMSRPLASVTSHTIPGTAGPRGVSTGFPFWSPDSQSFGFFADGMLKTLAADGGESRVLTAAPDGHGGTWSRDGVIVFAPTGMGPLSRISVDGRGLSPLTVLDASRREIAHRHPSFLPDGTHFVFVAISADPEHSGIWLGSLDSDERTFLVNSASKPMFVPPDRLLYMSESTLMSRSFDVRTLEFTAAPIVIARNIGTNERNSAAAFTASANGHLAVREMVPEPSANNGPITVLINRL